MHGGALVALSEISDELALLKALEQASQVPVWKRVPRYGVWEVGVGRQDLWNLKTLRDRGDVLKRAPWRYW